MAPSVQVGDKAPDFTLPSQSGEPLRLQDRLGERVVVLYFYPKDNTPGCTAEACAFRDSHETFTDAGAEVIGVSSDSSDRHAAFAGRHNLPFTLLADEDHKISEDYTVWVEKSMYGKKYMGVERTTFIIDKDGKVAKIFRKVKPAGHAEEVKQALAAL